MDKRKISAKELVSDIKSGMSDAQLMAKHELTPKGLQSALSKLVGAGLINAASLRERGTVKVGPEPGALEGDGSSPGPAVSDEKRPVELLQNIAYDVKSGLHDSDLMRRYELSPGKLKQIKDELVRLGYLSDVHVLGPEAKKTKQCPFCSKEIQESAARCVHCGQWLHAGAAGVRMGPPQPGMGPHEGAFSDGSEEPEEDCPWEDRGSYGTLNAFFQTATKCLLTPTAFFSTLPRRGGFLNPILFGVMSVVASFVLAYIWYSLLKGGGGGLFVFLIGIPFVVLGAFMLVPIGLFLGSGILHLCLLLVGGANEGYQATFRVASYSSVTSLFNAIPVLGAIASLWGIVLTVIGLREVHKTSTGKSVAAVLIPVGLAILLAVGAIAMGAFAVTNWAMRPLSQSARSQTPQTDVCSALEDYIVKMDALKDEDPKEIPAQARQALTELEKVLKQSRGGGNVGRVRQFGRALFARTVAPTQVEEKILGFQAGLSQLDDALRKEREALLQICGK